MIRRAALALCLASPAAAQDFIPFSDNPEADAFVAATLTVVFYHEIGHALIDVLQLPVLGREEDAADTIASMLIEDLWDDAAAAELVSQVTYYLLLASREEEDVLDGVHSLNAQRYYNTVCLFFGADMEGRAAIAQDLQLTPERAQTCGREFDLARRSWEELMGPVPVGEGQANIVLADEFAQNPITDLLADEVAFLNDSYALPETIEVRVESCGEANAFYVSAERKIRICTEMADRLLQLYHADQ